jgi:uncharacterized protein
MNGPAMNGPAMNDPAMNGPAMNGPAMNGPAVTGAARIGREYTGRHRRDSGPGPLRPESAGRAAGGGRVEPDRGLRPGPGPVPWPRRGASGGLRSDAG